MWYWQKKQAEFPQATMVILPCKYQEKNKYTYNATNK